MKRAAELLRRGSHTCPPGRAIADFLDRHLRQYLKISVPMSIAYRDCLWKARLYGRQATPCDGTDRDLPTTAPCSTNDIILVFGNASAPTTARLPRWWDWPADPRWRGRGVVMFLPN